MRAIEFGVRDGFIFDLCAYEDGAYAVGIESGRGLVVHVSVNGEVTRHYLDIPGKDSVEWLGSAPVYRDLVHMCAVVSDRFLLFTVWYAMSLSLDLRDVVVTRLYEEDGSAISHYANWDIYFVDSGLWTLRDSVVLFSRPQCGGGLAKLSKDLKVLKTLYYDPSDQLPYKGYVVPTGDEDRGKVYIALGDDGREYLVITSECPVDHYHMYMPAKELKDYDEVLYEDYCMDEEGNVLCSDDEEVEIKEFVPDEFDRALVVDEELNKVFDDEDLPPGKDIKGRLEQALGTKILGVRQVRVYNAHKYRCGCYQGLCGCFAPHELANVKLSELRRVVSGVPVLEDYGAGRLYLLTVSPIGGFKLRRWRYRISEIFGDEYFGGFDATYKLYVITDGEV